MKLYPADIAEKLEYRKIVEILASFSITPMAAEQLIALSPSNDADYIKHSLRQTSEFIELQNSGFQFPDYNYKDIRIAIEQLQIQDYVLSENLIVDIRIVCHVIKQIVQFLNTHKSIAPHLFQLIENCTYEKSISDAIDVIMNEEGIVHSNASKELERIRKEQIQKTKALDSSFRKLISYYKNQKYTADTVESIRNGRRVAAILAEHKRAVKGIIHDESESGKTVFIEPEETVFLNNELFELERAERREIYRLLKDLCNYLRTYTANIQQYQNIIIASDIVQAKARLANVLHATEPGILKNAAVKLHKAYHPLLRWLNDKTQKSTIPLSASLNAEQQIILISGPNAGGKSVALKTIALIQLMFQSGLHIPADGTSELGIFNDLMADVGDSQSLEDELSTYSSRLKYMRYFIEHATSNTLFFIDEFGTGTDPVLGGAMAEAILHELVQKKAKGVINTHYGNLKMYAEKNKHIVNAAMIFDEAELQPTYKMQIGKPGSSYTFVIAQKNKLPESVVQYAKQLVGKNTVRYEDLLSKIESERKDIRKVGDDLEAQDKRLKELIRKFEIQNRELEYQKKKLKYEYFLQKKQFEEKLEQEIQGVLKEINLANNEKEKKSKDALKAVQEDKKQSNALIEKSKQELASKKVQPILKLHDWVRIIDTQEVGQITGLQKNKAEVQFDHFITRISIDMLEYVDVNKIKKITPIAARTSLNTQDTYFEIDIRGKLKEEAFPELEQFMDKAIVGGLNEVRIVHGKGGGILKTLVRQFVKGYKEVKEIYHPAHEHGGDGVSIVRLN